MKWLVTPDLRLYSLSAQFCSLICVKPYYKVKYDDQSEYEYDIADPYSEYMYFKSNTAKGYDKPIGHVLSLNGDVLLELDTPEKGLEIIKEVIKLLCDDCVDVIFIRGDCTVISDLDHEW